MTTKHTEGPWAYEIYTDDETGAEPYLIRPVGNVLTSTLLEIVATVGRCNDDEDKQGDTESEANARLIAAAPDLLEFISACFDCKSADELHDFVINNAETLIAKTKGEL